MICSDELWDVRSGRITFDHFVRTHGGDIRKLVSKASYGAQYDKEDLIQEFLIEMHDAIQTAWPDSDIRKHVIFRACAAVNKAMRRRWVRADIYGDVEPPASSAAHPSCEGGQEILSEARRRVKSLPNSDLQRAVMVSLMETGSVDAAVTELLRDEETRRMFAGTADPRRTVTVTAKKLADRAQAA